MALLRRLPLPLPLAPTRTLPLTPPWVRVRGRVGVRVKIRVKVHLLRQGELLHDRREVGLAARIERGVDQVLHPPVEGETELIHQLLVVNPVRMLG